MTGTDVASRSTRPSGHPVPRSIGRSSEGADADELRAEVETLREENLRARREIADLREAVMARDVFLGTAGLELRNAMGGILVAATNLRFRASHAPGVPAWVGERVELITRQSRSFVRRATTLLDVSRLSTGALRLNLARVAWTEVVLAVVAELDLEAERAGCEIEITADEAVDGAWDRDALEQVTANLVSNAIKYGAGQPIGIALSHEGDAGVLRVTDRGLGIAEVDRARIFERFERAVRPGDQPGFGLGLWIARQLVRAHGGEIEVAAVAGVGSIFTVRLPGVIREFENDEPARIPSAT
jgi:signal transduction histidine kinase